MPQRTSPLELGFDEWSRRVVSLARQSIELAGWVRKQTPADDYDKERRVDLPTWVRERLREIEEAHDQLVGYSEEVDGVIHIHRFWVFAAEQTTVRSHGLSADSYHDIGILMGEKVLAAFRGGLNLDAKGSEVPVGELIKFTPWLVNIRLWPLIGGDFELYLAQIRAEYIFNHGMNSTGLSTREQECSGKYIYHRKGAYFEVRFGEEIGSIPVQLAGAWYILWLLQSPNRNRPVGALRNSLAAWQRGNRGAVARARDLETKDVPDAHYFEDPTEEISYLKKDASRIKNELEDAVAIGDEADVERCTTELEWIADRMKKLTGRDGKPKVTPSSRADESSVREAIQRVRDSCREKWGMKEFSQHLDSISTGATLRYEPSDPAPDWQF